MRTQACLLCVFVAAGLVTTTAFAANNRYQGTLCQPAAFADVAKVGYSQWGIHNVSNSTANVDCGGAPTVGADVFPVEVVVYDRNPAAASNVCCTIQIQNANGTIIASAVRCSAGSAGPAQTLSYTPPFNAVGTVNMECSIPAVTVNGVSHITSYRISSNP